MSGAKNVDWEIPIPNRLCVQWLSNTLHDGHLMVIEYKNGVQTFIFDLSGLELPTDVENSNRASALRFDYVTGSSQSL